MKPTNIANLANRAQVTRRSNPVIKANNTQFYDESASLGASCSGLSATVSSTSISGVSCDVLNITNVVVTSSISGTTGLPQLALSFQANSGASSTAGTATFTIYNTNDQGSGTNIVQTYNLTDGSPTLVSGVIYAYSYELPLTAGTAATSADLSVQLS